MNRKRKMIYNSIFSVLGRIILILTGLILPRLYLVNYGSNTYGLVTSITQFLNIVTLMELGIGAVVQSSLYKPLADNNMIEVSKIYKSSTRFFLNISIVFIIYLSGLVFIYPLILTEYSFIYVSTLIILIASGIISQYFLGMTNKLLLIADQKTYIVQLVDTLFLILNFIVIVPLITKGFSIHFVKLIGAITYIGRPLVLIFYVKHKYQLLQDISYNNEPIKQKWNGIVQHIAYYIVNSTDIIVLTIFSRNPLISVSIYSIYYMVTNGLKLLFETVVSGSMVSYFGNKLSNNEPNLGEKFKDFEWVLHSLVTLIFTTCGVLIVEFVLIYTDGVVDTDYFQPVFGVFITLAMAVFCLRLPYNAIIRAAGHYKETQLSALIELAINLSVSVILVQYYDILGVSIGTFLAMSYRTIYFANHISKIVPKYSMKIFTKNILIDLCTAILVPALCSIILPTTSDFMGWLFKAISVIFITGFSILVMNAIFNRKSLNEIKSRTV